jgi:adenosylcobinamide-phosphate synthase
MTVTLTLCALLIEAVVGYPDRLVRSIGHPVTWIGRLIGVLERHCNSDTAEPVQRRAFGIITLFLVVSIVAVVAFVIERGLLLLPFGLAGVGFLASTLIAQRSLHEHVAGVADALEQAGAEGGRQAVVHIVGRDTEALDEAGIARAAIESLAENFSDGIVAPAFWLAVAGLPGAALYKAANTADSMIGHRTPRYAAFGRAAARRDDVANLPASRLATLFLIAGAAMIGASPGGALKAAWRDASRHRSPNAGWPEAAMAGALGLQLAGPRIYGDETVDDAFMGGGRREASAADIRRALRLFRAACMAQWLLLLAIVVIWRG